MYAGLFNVNNGVKSIVNVKNVHSLHSMPEPPTRGGDFPEPVPINSGNQKMLLNSCNTLNIRGENQLPVVKYCFYPLLK